MQFARKIVLLSAVVMMGAAGGAAAKENDLTNATKPVSVVTVEGMTEYRLPNGLRVVLYPDMSKPTATVNMTYLVGSRHENYGETGMAHLLEHLMFKGSKNYPNPTAEFTKRGFRMNGSTWLDRTNYHVSFTASDDNMKWALGWQPPRLCLRCCWPWPSAAHGKRGTRSRTARNDWTISARSAGRPTP